MPFPTTDPVGPADAPLPAADVAFIADRLATRAAEIETSGVPRALLTELGARGLFGAPHPRQRELAELLAGSSADAWFCWAQHATPLRTLESAEGPAATDQRDVWLARLRAGEAIAAVAFAHLRRPGPPNPSAERVGDGWLLNGTLDWITSWDIADVVLLMVRGDANVVQILLPTSSIPAGMQVGPVLDLVAMRGTHTRPATLHDALIPDSAVLDVVPFEHWQHEDARKTMDINPGIFGITRSAIAELDDMARDRDDALLADLVGVLVDECRRVRRASYETGGPELRAEALALAMRAATAVVTARAGKAMQAGCAADRLVRWTLFLQVQAQTRAGRDAALRSLINEPENRVE